MNSNDGRELIVSIAANNATAKDEKVMKVQRELLEWFYFNL
jgi:hypothetical protein